MQLIGLLVAFVVILVLVGRRVSLALSLLAGTGVLALSSLMPPRDLALSLLAGLSQTDTVELVLAVAVITALAGVLKRFGLLDEMVRSVTALLGGARLAIMAVPSIIGSLSVLGGAILSAPMVDLLGDRLALTRPRKAAVNLVYRHAWFYVAPFSPSLVLASRLADVPLGQFILRLAPFAILMLVAGYVVLLRRAGAATPESLAAETAATSEYSDLSPRRAILPFLRSVSPLAVGIVLSVRIGGVALPLYGAIGVGLVLALFLSRKHADFRLGGLPATWSGIQWPIVVTVAGVMVFSRVMEDSGTAGALVEWLVSSGLPLWVLFVTLPVAIGFITGVPMAYIGIAYPVLMPLVAPGHELMGAAVVYAAGFLAYFTSPLHLCLVLSSQYFKEAVPGLYREYWPVVLSLAALTAGYAWLLFA